MVLYINRCIFPSSSGSSNAKIHCLYIPWFIFWSFTLLTTSLKSLTVSAWPYFWAFHFSKTIPLFMSRGLRKIIFHCSFFSLTAGLLREVITFRQKSVHNVFSNIGSCLLAWKFKWIEFQTMSDLPLRKAGVQYMTVTHGACHKHRGTSVMNYVCILADNQIMVS